MSLPAWSGAFENLGHVAPLPLPGPLRDWAWGDATGAGVKVAVVDSGINADHPLVGRVDGYAALHPDPDAEDGYRVEEGPHEDLVGHGTACAGIIRSLAPAAEIHSVRVLGANLKGQGALLLGGIEWAIDHQMDVVNLSLSSKSPNWFAALHEVADRAYFNNVVLVCAANNSPGPTYPSEFASVISVASRETRDPWSLAYNPNPPVEFAARGIDVEVAWGEETIVATGNSFAAPHVTGMVAALRSRHPELNPFQIKAVLQAASENAR